MSGARVASRHSALTGWTCSTGTGCFTQSTDLAAERVAHILDLQPLGNRFLPADPSQFAGLALDPSGLLACTLPVDTSAKPSQNVVYEPRAALLVAGDPAVMADAFRAAVVQSITMRQ